VKQPFCGGAREHAADIAAVAGADHDRRCAFALGELVQLTRRRAARKRGDAGRHAGGRLEVALHDDRRMLEGAPLPVGKRHTVGDGFEWIRVGDQQLGAGSAGQRHGERDGVDRTLGVVHADDDLGHGHSSVSMCHDSRRLGRL
jgi:hypothetical protein